MKNIIVFGASGRTGKMVVQYALDAGHKVTAFDHQHTLTISHPNLNMQHGSVYNVENVFEAINGHDVVISTLGVKQIDGPAVNLMSDAMKIFTDVMAAQGIKRVLAVGGLAVLQLDENTQLIDKPDYPAEYKNVGEGHNKVYKVLRVTDLDWTFVCCPDIIDGPKTGHYNVNKNYPATGKFRIFTGDLADFIVKEMEANQFIKTRVGIANTE